MAGRGAICDDEEEDDDAKETVLDLDSEPAIYSDDDEWVR